jgi:2-polyprenyl-3-methyl-5-hydroxy-6-metoxy-1,4-benzoquinol methylase
MEVRVMTESAAESFETAQREYYGDASAFEPPHVRRFLDELATARFRQIRRYLGAGRVLEVGPGGGQLLGRLRDAGFSVQGVEHSPEVARRLREKLAVPVAEGGLEAVDLSAGGFDAVVSMHVIEHVPSPLAHLSRARELVRSGGYLFLATPNLGGWSRRVAGRRWCGYSSAHIFLFTPESLEACLEKTGWHREGGYSIESAYGWPRALKSMLQKPGLVRASSPGVTADRRLPSWVLASVACAFGVVSWPGRAVQGALGGGDELFVIARRADSNDLA